MNTVSIASASLASSPQPVKAQSQASGESGFKGQLQDAIQERKPQRGTKDAKQGEAEKKDIPLPPPPATVAIVLPTLPPPPVGSFGLPSAGVEAGPKTENKPAAVEHAPAIDRPKPETSTISPPKPPAEIIQPNVKTVLAFALRLADLTPNREVHLAEAAQQPAPLAQTVQPDLKTGLTSALPLVETPQQLVIAPLLAFSPPVASQRNTDTTLIAPPIKIGEPAQQPAVAATPVIAIMPPGEGATAQSGSHANDGGASGKETPNHVQPQPATDLKSFRQASATPQSVSSASRQTPLQTPGSAPTVLTSAPLATPAPEPSSSMTAAAPIARVSIPLAAPNPASHVTDVSVNIQLPRADASGDDRVAIRMLQRGSEIHVSVRTPDSQLSQSLRQDLGKLTTGLDQEGFHTETWRPAPTNAAAQSNSNPQHQPPQGNPNRDTAGSNARSGGNGGQGAGEQKRRQQDERPRWVAELEQQRNQ